MYILLVGRVDVFRASAAGGTQTAGSLLPGDVFGGREYFTDVDDCVYTAGMDSVVFVITRDSFNDMSWSRPDILFEILRGAYMPLRKLTASQKTAMAAAAQEPVAKPKPPASKKSVSELDKALEAVPEAIDEKVDAPETEPQTSPAAQASPALGGIFPDGHKLYPGIVKPEYAKLVFPKEYECPFCKKPFTDFRVSRSKLYESSPMRFDLRRFYTDFQTEWYDVITCQNCLFSTFHNLFTEPKPIKKDKVNDFLTDARSSIILDFSGPRDIDFVFTSHFLAIQSSEAYISLGRQLRAKLWGNISWLYEDVEDEEMAKFAANKTAEAYEAVYAETHLTPVQEQVTCLSIAGMQHRAGVDRNLKRFLFTAKTIKMGDRTYAKMAEDFMYEIRMDDPE